MLNDSKKEISLIGRDFSGFRKNLIDFAKQYYPNTYNDFNESSPGTMFIEMASYVGDVLSYYTDVQSRESILTEARQYSNILNLANSFGYKPKLYSPATTNLVIYQLVPSTGTGNNIKPDLDYALKIKEGMQVSSTQNPNVVFSTTRKVDFAYSSSFDPTEITVYKTKNSNPEEPEFYLFKKSVPVISGEEKILQFTFGSPKPYDKIKISDIGIIDAVKIIDSDGDVWTKVDYLAQDTVFEQIPNTSDYTLNLNQYGSETPYLLRLKKVPKRFISKFDKDNSLIIQFGAGVSTSADEELLPNPGNVGSNLYKASGDLSQTIDPSNFLYTKTYGVAPANTTLTVIYRVGQGVLDNVPSKDLINITNLQFDNEVIPGNSTLFNQIKNSVAATNEEAASGGKFEDAVDDIRNNTMAFFASQNRNVTAEDYVIRAYAMPPQFGAVAKAYIAPDYQIKSFNRTVSGVASVGSLQVPNPLALNLYVLGYDGNGNITQLNPATKQNLKNYISYYRMLTDAVNIKDAYIINIGIDFEIVVLPSYNSNEVLLNCINQLKLYFSKQSAQINRPILLSDVYVLLDRVDGVQTVIRPDLSGYGGLQIINKYDTIYSPIVYDIKKATRNGIIYPAKDPSIFEVKFPDLDIRGRVVPLF
jgi:hypothetical protein